MKLTILILTICFCGEVFSDPAKNHEFFYNFLNGTYILVGKSVDNESTYLGKMLLTSKGDHLEVLRTIDGNPVKGTGHIEHALGPDQANVLRVRFSENGNEFEATYLWRVDLDNYARLSGYLYLQGENTKSPGLEVLFIDRANQ